jgi:hypothetical protein
MGGMGGGGAKDPRASWTALITSPNGDTDKASGGFGSGGGLGVPGGRAGGAGIPSGGGSGAFGQGGGAAKPSTPEKPEKPGPQLVRTEFVVLLIWKENTPSDKLRPTTVIEAPAAGGAGSPTGGGGGMSGGMSGMGGGGAGGSSDARK